MAQQTAKPAAPVPPTPPKAPETHGPEIQPDGTVTFRFPAPNAKSVLLDLEGAAAPAPMSRGEDGVWSATSAALAPELYEYSFSVDGVHALDPANVTVKTSFFRVGNVLHVPGKTPMPWEIADVPHGVVHHHFYHSAVVGIPSDFYVYTPPNYDPKAKYPVLYLLHGYSDDASVWTVHGKANIILDNLIAQGKAKPMIVVMPLGYGTMDVITRGWTVWQDRATILRNYSQFTEALLTEVKPQVEKLYPISQKREDHAIAGLSMGGGETLLTGLNHLDEFSYIGAFSSAVQDMDYAQLFPGLNASANQKLQLLWIACGKQDQLLTPNQHFIAWLQQQGVHVTPIETEGRHEWPVWRGNLVSFAPLLFQHKGGWPPGQETNFAAVSDRHRSRRSRGPSLFRAFARILAAIAACGHTDAKAVAAPRTPAAGRYDLPHARRQSAAPVRITGQGGLRQPVGHGCPPCVAEVPSIQKLMARHRDDPKLVFVLAVCEIRPNGFVRSGKSNTCSSLCTARSREIFRPPFIWLLPHHADFCQRRHRSPGTRGTRGLVRASGVDVPQEAGRRSGDARHSRTSHATLREANVAGN